MESLYHRVCMHMFSLFYIGNPDPDRGLNVDVENTKQANNEIVAAIIRYLKSLKSSGGLPAKARDHIIKILEQSNLFKQFHLRCTAKERIVQIDFEFEGISGDPHDPNTWKIKITIDVDKPPDYRPHMGYEIHFNNKKVQVGHAYLPNGVLEVGRPAKKESDLLEDIEKDKGDTRFDQQYGGGGSMKWKFTEKRRKRS